MRAPGLAAKLGIKPGTRTLLQGAPAEFIALLGTLPDGAKLLKRSTGGADCVVAFVRNQADVKRITPSALSAITDDGLLWFAYPKLSGPLKSDLSRDEGWEPLFRAGFDTVAQISIDETWTGFRFRAKRLVGKSRNAN